MVCVFQEVVDRRHHRQLFVFPLKGSAEHPQHLSALDRAIEVAIVMVIEKIDHTIGYNV